MNLPEVCYTGPYLDASGYGEATRNYIRALHEVGYPVYTEKVSFTGSKHYEGENAILADSLNRPSQKNHKIKILHLTPDTYKLYMTAGAYHIGHLFWETSKLPDSWVSACNKMDEIWTGTKLGATAMVSSGVTTPIYAIPQAINVSVPDVRPFKLPNVHDDDLIFYTIIDWNERKNPRALIETYWKTFQAVNDTVLFIKTHKGNYSDGGAEQIASEIRSWKETLGLTNTPRIVLNTDLLTDEEKHRIHKMGDVFVSTHRGEGWGLPQMEALVHGKHVMSVAYGGIHEYLNNRKYDPIKYSLVDVGGTYNTYYTPGMLWAEVDKEHLSQLLSHQYQKFKKALTQGYNKKDRTKPHGSFWGKASQGNTLVTGAFSYKAVGEIMAERLRQIGETL